MKILNLKHVCLLLTLMLFSSGYVVAQNTIAPGFLQSELGELILGSDPTNYHTLKRTNTTKLDFTSGHINAAHFRFKSKTNKLFGSIGGWLGEFGLRDKDEDWFLTTYADQFATLRVDNNIAMQWYADGKVRIGDVSTAPSGYKLFVEEGILAEKVRVALDGASDWADYVFEDDYKLMPLHEVDQFIKKNNHLPNVPSADEMVESGLDVLESDAILLRKIEEAYLYILQQQEQLDELKKEITNLRN